MPLQCGECDIRVDVRGQGLICGISGRFVALDAACHVACERLEQQVAGIERTLRARQVETGPVGAGERRAGGGAV
jgi:hypothetical protein